jgi:hypothetical protein
MRVAEVRHIWNQILTSVKTLHAIATDDWEFFEEIERQTKEEKKLPIERPACSEISSRSNMHQEQSQLIHKDYL